MVVNYLARFIKGAQKVYKTNNNLIPNCQGSRQRAPDILVKRKNEMEPFYLEVGISKNMLEYYKIKDTKYKTGAEKEYAVYPIIFSKMGEIHP